LIFVDFTDILESLKFAGPCIETVPVITEALRLESLLLFGQLI